MQTALDSLKWCDLIGFRDSVMRASQWWESEFCVLIGYLSGQDGANEANPSYHVQKNLVNMTFLTVQFNGTVRNSCFCARIRGLGRLEGILGSFLSLYVWGPCWPTGSCIYFCVGVFPGSVDKIKDHGRKLKRPFFFSSCETNAILFGSCPTRPHKARERGWIRVLI